MPFATLIRSAILVFGIVGCALASAGPASADQRSHVVPWRGDELSPTVKDATRSPAFWRTPAAVAEWRDLDANIDPLMSNARRTDITIVELASPNWLAKSEVFVRDGYVTHARILLNPALKRVPYTRAMADQVLCQELGKVLGLRAAGTPGSCMSRANLGTSTSPNVIDEARLRRLYSTASSSVSNDPSITLGLGRWFTVHVFRKR